MAATPIGIPPQSSLKGPPPWRCWTRPSPCCAERRWRRSPSITSGRFPFCLALIYFYFDMTQSADAEAHLPGEALL